MPCGRVGEVQVRTGIGETTTPWWLSPAGITKDDELQAAEREAYLPGMLDNWSYFPERVPGRRLARDWISRARRMPCAARYKGSAASTKGTGQRDFMPQPKRGGFARSRPFRILVMEKQPVLYSVSVRVRFCRNLGRTTHMVKKAVKPTSARTKPMMLSFL